ncbi:MAG: glycosyltransferase, partial [Beijerinckiaceae bacterium]
SRLETLKRQRLLIAALAQSRSAFTAVIVGDGGDRAACEALVDELDVRSRVRFLGAVSRDHLLSLYAQATAVFFGPFDEDYGYVTLEAMLAGKPVITCHDSGGPLEFVVNGETGLVTSPDAAAIADALDRMFAEPAHAASLGQAGQAHYRAKGISWDGVVQRLVEAKPTVRNPWIAPKRSMDTR